MSALHSSKGTVPDKPSPAPVLFARRGPLHLALSEGPRSTSFAGLRSAAPAFSLPRRTASLSLAAPSEPRPTSFAANPADPHFLAHFFGFQTPHSPAPSYGIDDPRPVESLEAQPLHQQAGEGESSSRCSSRRKPVPWWQRNARPWPARPQQPETVAEMLCMAPTQLGRLKAVVVKDNDVAATAALNKLLERVEQMHVFAEKMEARLDELESQNTILTFYAGYLTDEQPDVNMQTRIFQNAKAVLMQDDDVDEVAAKKGVLGGKTATSEDDAEQEPELVLTISTH